MIPELNIPPYILENRVWYKYLHIIGGSGNCNDKKEEFLIGGEYDFIVFYAAPSEMKGLDKCAMFWCREKNIPYGIGNTINEAFENLTKQIIP